MKNFRLMDTEIRSDERGWVIEPIDADDLASAKIRNVHVVSLKPGAVRGNHYHTGHTEYVVIIGGSCGAPRLKPWHLQRLRRNPPKLTLLR